MSADQYERYVQQLDPEVRPAVEGFVQFYEGGYDLSTPDKIRDVRARRAARRRETNVDFPAPSVSTEDRRVPGYHGDPDVPVRIYRPEPADEPGPAMLWIHGGGFVMGDVDGEDVVCSRMAHNAGVLVVSVEYRLAPEHPYPGPLHDCHAAYRWLVSESRALGVDGAKIIIGGTSAGGGLTAALCQVLRDQHEPAPLLQVLAAPALDDRTEPVLSDERIEAPPFSRNLLSNSWYSYLGTRANGPHVPLYAAAGRATNLSGLPPAYISVGALDPLLDENFAYARALIGAGVPAEVHVYPGGCHGFESFAPLAAISQRCLDDREAAVRRALA